LEQGNTIRPRGRRRRILAVTIAVNLIAIGVIAFWPGPKEPEYDGKKLSEWLKICCDNRAGSSYSQSQSLESARKAVRKIGTNGLPWLVKWINYDTPKWKSALLYSKIYRWMPTSIRDPMVRPILQAQRAREGFNILGTAASPVIPELLRMTDRWPRVSSVYAISAIRGCDAQPDALSALIAIATDHSRPLEARRTALQAIVNVHSVEKYESWVVPAILPCVQEQEMAESAVRALASFKISPDVGVPVMTTATVAKSAEVRVWAVVALGRYGTNATPAIPALLHAVHDSDPRVQQEATDALKAIAPEALTNTLKNL
jgi:HEAT repeat protein